MSLHPTLSASETHSKVLGTLSTMYAGPSLLAGDDGFNSILGLG